MGFIRDLKKYQLISVFYLVFPQFSINSENPVIDYPIVMTPHSSGCHCTVMSNEIVILQRPHWNHKVFISLKHVCTHILD